MASDTMQIAALGHPFGLGMLYDARKDELLPGLKLWDDEALQWNVTDVPQPCSTFEIAASDSMESRSSLVNVSYAQKTSFLCGLITVRGSASYLNAEIKNNKHQSRVTCLYKATTNFKELSVTRLKTMDTHQMDVIKQGSATHVVTGILYGAKAFFVFDSEKLGTSDEGRIKEVMEKIPLFCAQKECGKLMSDEEKALCNKFSCKFYGDFILDKNPTNFEEALKTYADLPKLLRKDGENGVPLTVWLRPLKEFASETAELKNDISAELVRKAQDTLEKFREIEMRCNDSQDDSAIQYFPQIQKELKRFQSLCEHYEQSLQQTMAEKLPLIRSGKEDESSIEQFFKDGDKSPFSYEKLSKWLEHEEREINIIRSILDTMKDAKIVPNQSELDREVLASGVDHALCFVFTSLESDDPWLNVMKNYLDSEELTCVSDDQWRHSHEVMKRMKKKAEEVQNLAKALKKNKRFRFLVADIDNKKYKGASIYHYKEGCLVTDDFSKPDIQNVKEITDKNDLIWYATDLTLDPNTANGYLTLSEENKKATCTSWQKYPDHPDRFNKQPQVLCREGLSGRHYWEAELSNGSKDSVFVIFGYKGVERKGSGSESHLGHNTISWSFGKSTYYDRLQANHNGLVHESPIPPEGCNTIGVYLDWPGGTLSFYRVCTNTLRHLYTFENKFTEPLYPGIWAYYYDNYVRLNPGQ